MYQDLAKEMMEKVISNYHQTLSKIRTGRANPNMISGIEVDYYGAMTPLNQMGQISVVEGRQLMVKLYDTTQLKEVEKAINAANLGYPVQNDGSVIRINIPALTEETRKQLAKEVGKYEEEAKIAIRNVRRDINDDIKKADDLTEDDERRELDNVQKVTDDFIKQIEVISKEKEKEIMTV